MGQFCTVAGPNGAGKTSLLRALTGELPLSGGSIHFDGRDLNDWSIPEIAMRRGVLAQVATLDFPFTVRDVVEMGRMPHHTRDLENRRITDEVTELCDCHHLLDRAFPWLSGGEQQRVQIARVLAQVWEGSKDKPCFLLLDEPISALDLSHQYRIMNLLATLSTERGFGIISVLHNLNLATQFAHRCLLLDQGRLVADGVPKEVFTEETISNVFDLDIWVRHHPENENIPLIIPKIYDIR